MRLSPGGLQRLLLLAGLLFLLMLPTVALADNHTGTPGDGPGIPIPRIEIGIGESRQPADVAGTLQIIVLLTVLSLAPAILVLMTAFTRIIVVLSFARSALATQNMPPNQVLIGLALFLTFFVMAPYWNRVNAESLQPFLRGEIEYQEAVSLGAEPLREFMFKNAAEKDVALFVNLAGLERPESEADIPTYVLVPAFAISELRKAFQIGFLIFIPFIVIDMVVSATLMSMGMLMLPPMMISLPFKILLFVMMDGWHLIVRQLVLSFQ
jgi:flagellar biosynthesis protein FliP